MIKDDEIEMIEEFELGSILPEYIINSEGEKELFDLERILNGLIIDVGIENQQAENVIEAVVRKIVGLLSLQYKSISTNTIKDFICDELTNRGLDKFREIYERTEKKKKTKFVLPEDFIDIYRWKQPSWGPLGYITFKRTYARIVEDENRTEEFFETIRRVIEGCFSLQKEHCIKLRLPWDEEKGIKSAKIMYNKMWNFKFIAPGRGLWTMGTKFIDRHGSMALNNCFASETEILTRDGIKKVGDCAGTIQEVLTRNRKWVKAPIRQFGKQKLMKLTLTRQGSKKIIYATPEHRWFAKSRAGIYRKKGFQEFFTRDLKENYRLKYEFPNGIKNITPSPFGIAHGICFGDATSNHLYLCGDKDKDLEKYFPLNNKTIDPNKCEGGAIRIANLPKYFKKTPNLDEDKSYLFGWLAG